MSETSATREAHDETRALTPAMPEQLSAHRDGLVLARAAKAGRPHLCRFGCPSTDLQPFSRPPPRSYTASMQEYADCPIDVMRTE
jgi:hypothetical protein